MSDEPSREHPPPFREYLPSFPGWEKDLDIHLQTHTHSRLRQVRTQHWDREVSKRYGEGFLEEMGPKLRS